jgi:hypothetical protein
MKLETFLNCALYVVTVLLAGVCMYLLIEELCK